MARSINAQPYLSLDRYRQLMGLPLCLFNGVEGSGEVFSACDHCWSQWERDMVARALAKAEDTLASYLNFYLGPRFLIDYDLPWTDPMTLRWGHILGGGIQGLTIVVPTADNFAVDPATITVNTADFPGGTSEILIVETATGLEIEVICRRNDNGQSQYSSSKDMSPT